MLDAAALRPARNLKPVWLMSIAPAVVTRFAPSPTGLLHLGNAYSALFSRTQARILGGDAGRFLLRIEDIDPARCRPEYEAAIYEDLNWLGLDWEKPVRRQSDHYAAYAAQIAQLQDEGLVYPCFCSRKDIAAATARGKGGTVPTGPDGPLYPGTCRHLAPSDVKSRLDSGSEHSLRLDMERAVKKAGSGLEWTDLTRGTFRATPEIFGDVVLARKDCPTSYHASVVLDDAWQGVTHVTRGLDLLNATHVHRLLQALWGLPVPLYHHHPLLTDPGGAQAVMSKRYGSLCIAQLRQAGHSPQDVLAMIDATATTSDPAAKADQNRPLDDAATTG